MVIVAKILSNDDQCLFTSTVVYSSPGKIRNNHRRLVLLSVLRGGGGGFIMRVRM